MAASPQWSSSNILTVVCTDIHSTKGTFLEIFYLLYDPGTLNSYCISDPEVSAVKKLQKQVQVCLTLIWFFLSCLQSRSKPGFTYMLWISQNPCSLKFLFQKLKSYGTGTEKIYLDHRKGLRDLMTEHPHLSNSPSFQFKFKPRSSWFTYCWSLPWRIFEYYLANMWNEYNWVVV